MRERGVRNMKCTWVPLATIYLYMGEWGWVLSDYFFMIYRSKRAYPSNFYLRSFDFPYFLSRVIFVHDFEFL